MAITRTMPETMATVRELTAPLEIAELFLRLPQLALQPRGSGETVLVFPGFGGGDGSTALLRRYLGFLGYRVRGWGLGTNRGNVPVLLEQLAEAVAEQARADAAPVRLLGWSLGGYLAREVARDLPECVERVITLGSPVVGGPRYTLTAPIYRLAGVDLEAIDNHIRLREEVPLQVPVTAIYSRRDGIVNWQACIDHVSDCVEHVEVDASHLGMGANPRVLQLVARKMQ
jgi:hypothetical protein